MEEFLGTQDAVIEEDAPTTYDNESTEGNREEGNREERSSEDITASSENSDDTASSESKEDAQTAPVTPVNPANTVKSSRRRNTTQYTLEEKKALVERAHREGKSKVAREAGIVVQTLYNWEAALMKQSKESGEEKDAKDAKDAEGAKDARQPKEPKQPKQPKPITVIKSVPEQKKDGLATQNVKTDIEVENVILRAKVARLTNELANFKHAITSLVSEF